DDFDDRPTANDIRPILDTITDKYRDAETDQVRLIYTEHMSNLSQIAKTLAILPASFEVEAEAAAAGQPLTDVTFEPSVQEVLDNVTIRLLEVQIWQALLE